MPIRCRAALLALCLLVLPAQAVPAAATAAAAGPADPAARPAAAQLLDWLGQLPDRAGNRVVSGYFGGYSGSTFSLAQTEELRQATGQYPGLLACDYGSGGSVVEHSCNPALTDWWRAGGLVSVSVHVPNPAQPDFAGLYTHLDGFGQLTDPSTALGAEWQRTLARIGDGLAELAAADVPVLFRPLHEMNMTGPKTFWWSGQDRAEYRAVWQHMFRYLTERRGLHNLLWVYSPLCGSGDRSAYYPGAAYTDVVALDCYPADPAAAQGYEELTRLGKPFAFAEIGPPSDPVTKVPVPGSYDYRRWIEAIRTRYPATTYFLAWNDNWRPTEHQGATELMNDRWTVNRGEIDLTARTAAAGPARPNGTVQRLAGFETGTEGWTGWLTQAGPWSVTEWAAEGTRSLKADLDLAAPEAYLNRVGALDLTGHTALSALVRTAPWGTPGTTAKLYLRTGTGWYDSGATVPGPDGAVLTLPLGLVPDPADVREIGIRFAPPAGATGRTAGYLDDVTLTPAPVTLADFEGGVDGWSGWKTKNGPWSVTEWAARGSRSFKTDVDLAGGESYLLRRYATPVDLTGRTELSATVRTAEWGDHATGTKAKPYVKTGPSCTWHDAGTTVIGPTATELHYNLAGVPDLGRVCELGVQYVYAPAATGQSAVYLDAVTLR